MHLVKKIGIGIICFLVVMVYLLQFTSVQASWGFWGHKRINRMSVFTLPPEMFGFYKKNIEYITENAANPDKRRYAVKGEAEKHYIDIDHYGEYPFEMVPRKWEDAVEKYSEDSLRAYGISPWNIEHMLGKLTHAFRNRYTKRILRLSAELGHYIGDGHVPLHTTHNYNGQLTNQKGIHGFWESRIPELYGDDFDYWVDKAEYISEPNDHIWAFILQSAAAVDSVLVFERELNDRYDVDQKYCYETRGQQMIRAYCESYSNDYANMLDGMVERRLRTAVRNIGSYWFTAWVNAGQPDLDELIDPAFTDEDLKEKKELEELYKEAKSKNSSKGRSDVH